MAVINNINSVGLFIFVWESRRAVLGGTINLERYFSSVLISCVTQLYRLI